jgi:phosphate transport system ATP-binding protein
MENSADMKEASSTSTFTAVESDWSHHEVSIRVRDFSLKYGDFQALHSVSTDIRQGIVTGLIGPSGCGKTTLLRSFNRINERYGNVTTTGEISILGKNVLDPDVSVATLRKTVGMVFQRPNPLPISIYENIVFGVKSHIPSAQLSRSDLDRHVEESLTEVAMDEPCSALDASGIERIEELITSLKQRFTIVIVTHNMAQARRASDECIFMLMGEIIEHSPTLDMFMSPKNPKTAMYVEGRYG